MRCGCYGPRDDGTLVGRRFLIVDRKDVVVYGKDVVIEGKDVVLIVGHVIVADITALPDVFVRRSILVPVVAALDRGSDEL